MQCHDTPCFCAWASCQARASSCPYSFSSLVQVASIGFLFWEDCERVSLRSVLAAFPLACVCCRVFLVRMTVVSGLYWSLQAQLLL